MKNGVKSEDDLLAIAARIADGSGVDWSVTDSTEPQVLEDLKAIAHLAALHRTPAESPTGEASILGRRWGPLSVVEAVGAGRFGRVYRAWDARLERYVALKLVDAPAGAATSPLHAIDEARLLARVRHPNVLSVYGAECLDGQIGIWTEFLDGRTLEDILAATGPLSPDEVVTIGLDLSRALAAVHHAGLLHRDIKAQNVMRETGGRIVLMDFGTSHDLDLPPTRAGDLSGTPLYLAPEIFAGAPASPASDVYALAVVLFRLLSGSFPAPGRTLDDVRAAHRDGRTADIAQALPLAPGPLVAAIARGLAADPAARFQDARSFEAALAAVNSSAAFPTLPRASWRDTRWLMLVAIFALAGLGLVGWLVDGSVSGHHWMTLWQARQPPTALPLRIRLPDGTTGRPSKDGRVYPYLDSNRDVNVWEAVTGTSRRLTRAAANESGGNAVMSADGSRVAFKWALPDHAFELRMLNADGTWPRVLVDRETAYEPVPVDWSRDGQHILCWFVQRDGSWDLVLVPAVGGPPKLIRTFPSRQYAAASLSPDGRYVARFVSSGSARSGKSLEILPTDGSAPEPALELPPTPSAPVWSPSGREVAFFQRATLEGSGPADAWTVPVSRGSWAGPPRLVMKNSLPATLSVPFFAVVDDGRIQAQWVMASTDVYLASITSTAAEPIGVPTRISSTHIGEHSSAEWSPDGQSIAYLMRPMGTKDNTLAIHDLRTGADRLITTKLVWLSGYSPQWLDGESVIVDARDGPSFDRIGYFRVDVRTGETHPVVITGTDGNLGSFQCTRDGRTLLYVSAKRGLVAHDVSDGRESVLIPRPIGRFRLSPDGRSIAFQESRTITGADIESDMIEIRTPDGQVRPVVVPRGHDIVYLQSWPSDEVGILYTVASSWQLTESGHLWRTDAAGREPHDLHFANRGNTTNRMSVTRDGRLLLFTEADSYEELRTTPEPIFGWARPSIR